MTCSTVCCWTSETRQTSCMHLVKVVMNHIKKTHSKKHKQLASQKMAIETLRNMIVFLPGLFRTLLSNHNYVRITIVRSLFLYVLH